MSDIARIIGKRLSALREENGFTQEEIQKLTGINRTTYSKNESGKAAPSLANLHIFARLYGVSLDYLCDVENRSVMLYDSGKNMSKEEKMLVSYYRLLNDEQKEKLLEKIRQEAAIAVSK